jgi:uncharacterized protein YkwD
MSERSGSALRSCAAVVAALVVTLALAGCTPPRVQIGATSSRSAPATAPERHVIDSVNAFRAAHGLRALSWQANISDKAKLWAAWMAGGNCGRGPTGTPTICHSNLTSGITVSWTLLEENVGAASPATDIAAVVTGFEHSPEHAANILNKHITAIGVGVAYSGNIVFVAEDFMAQ